MSGGDDCDCGCDCNCNCVCLDAGQSHGKRPQRDLENLSSGCGSHANVAGTARRTPRRASGLAGRSCKVGHPFAQLHQAPCPTRAHIAGPGGASTMGQARKSGPTLPRGVVGLTADDTQFLAGTRTRPSRTSSPRERLREGRSRLRRA